MFRRLKAAVNTVVKKVKSAVSRVVSWIKEHPVLCVRVAIVTFGTLLGALFVWLGTWMIGLGVGIYTVYGWYYILMGIAFFAWCCYVASIVDDVPGSSYRSYTYSGYSRSYAYARSEPRETRDERMVRLLRAKAASTPFPEEAAAFNAKADEIEGRINA